MEKMTQFLLVVCLVKVIVAFPANNEKLDKATKNDVSLNLVTPPSHSETSQTSVSKVSITSSGTIGISSPKESKEEGPSKVTIETPSLPKPGTMFARFIDDVFQIPITVLQSVTKLLTNPFTQRHKDN